MVTNRELIDRAMAHLATGLGPFVDEQMAAAFPEGRDWVKALAARGPRPIPA